MPTTVPIYNSLMGGTDLLDQFTSYYENRLKSLNWQRRIFTHFIIVTAKNSHIIYNALAVQDQVRERPTFKFLAFMEVLIMELMEIPIELSELVDSDSDRDSSFDSSDCDDMDDRHSSDEGDDDGDRMEMETPNFRASGWMSAEGWAVRYHDPRGHFPCRTGAKKGRVDRRGKCMVYGAKGTVGCGKCGVTLCCDGEYGKNCFSRFHSTRKIR